MRCGKEAKKARKNLTQVGEAEGGSARERIRKYEVPKREATGMDGNANSLSLVTCDCGLDGEMGRWWEIWRPYHTIEFSHSSTSTVILHNTIN
jgi:hypothetical protein